MNASMIKSHFVRFVICTYLQNLPVMVFIHGGGYETGEAGMYGPKHLLDSDVILVVPNYRLGPFGFLHLEEDKSSSGELPTGNQGLWDQRLALQWVKHNIKAFGGDPDNVTLFGESAGGFSVSYHIISQQSKGLFDKAIIQSGSLLGSFTGASKTRSL